MSYLEIEKVIGREIIDSRGNPTVEAEVWLADGTIAGSATNLYLCMQKAISFGIPMEQAIRSATIIPARQIGREAEIGSIEPGKLADFVVCAPDLTPKAVYLGGEIVE